MKRRYHFKRTKVIIPALMLGVFRTLSKGRKPLESYLKS